MFTWYQFGEIAFDISGLRPRRRARMQNDNTSLSSQSQVTILGSDEQKRASIETKTTVTAGPCSND